MHRDPVDIAAFGENLLAILDRGSFTSTYKYAVLLALLDLALEATQRDGAPPTSVTTHQLAERVIESYWPHAAPFRDTERVLHQNQGGSGRAEVVSLIERFRSEHADPATPHRARTTQPTAFAKLLRDAEWVLVENPLPRLQLIGNEPIPFLYVITWDKGVRRGEFNGPEFDNSVRFVAGAAENLVRLSGLLRPLIQRDWAAHIARINDLPQARLEEFLFGVNRAALAPLRAPLVELQRGACFYCGERMRAETQVDHFVPWARHPNDAIENLVAAHPGCNGAKSDHLAASEHLRRWVERDCNASRELTRIATEVCWSSSLGLSLGVARGIYLRLPENTRLWQRRGSFERARHAQLAELLS